MECRCSPQRHGSVAAKSTNVRTRSQDQDMPVSIMRGHTSLRPRQRCLEQLSRRRQWPEAAPDQSLQARTQVCRNSPQRGSQCRHPLPHCRTGQTGQPADLFAGQSGHRQNGQLPGSRRQPRQPHHHHWAGQPPIWRWTRRRLGRAGQHFARLAPSTATPVHRDLVAQYTLQVSQVGPAAAPSGQQRLLHQILGVSLGGATTSGPGPELVDQLRIHTPILRPSACNFTRPE